jgi:hypothetical protein
LPRGMHLLSTPKSEFMAKKNRPKAVCWAGVFRYRLRASMLRISELFGST